VAKCTGRRERMISRLLSRIFVLVPKHKAGVFTAYSLSESYACFSHLPDWSVHHPQPRAFLQLDGSQSYNCPCAPAGLAPLAVSGFSPAQIRKAYGIDLLDSKGAGKTIAIVDAYKDQPWWLIWRLSMLSSACGCQFDCCLSRYRNTNAH